MCSCRRRPTSRRTVGSIAGGAGASDRRPKSEMSANASRVGLAIAVNDAHSLVKQHAHWTTPSGGGRGADGADKTDGGQEEEALFAAFHSTKAEGLGMGLAISRTIVEDHGGKLWFSSNDSGGATFHVTLPIAADVDA